MAKEIIIHVKVGNVAWDCHYVFDGREDFSEAIRKCLLPSIWNRILSGQYRIRERGGLWMHCDETGRFNVRSDIFNWCLVRFEVAPIEE